MKLTRSERDRIILEHYAAGKTQTEIKNILGHVGYCAVQDCLKRHNVKKRSHSNELKTYTIDPLCFNRAEESELASWMIGFLLADGCVRKTEKGQKLICLSVSEQDADAIEKFRLLLKTDQPIKKERNHWSKNLQHALRVTSPPLFDALREYGITPRKTGTEQLDLRLVSNRHAWRGIVDGDGSITWNTGGGRRSPCVFLASSSLILIEQFSEYSTSIGCSKTKIVTQTLKSGKNYYSLCATGRSAIILATELYKDSTYHLARKYNKATEVMNHIVRDGWKVRWGYS